MHAPADAGQFVVLVKVAVRGAEGLDPPVVGKEETGRADAIGRLARRQQRVVQFEVDGLAAVAAVNPDGIAAYAAFAADEELFA